MSPPSPSTRISCPEGAMRIPAYGGDGASALQRLVLRPRPPRLRHPSLLFLPCPRQRRWSQRAGRTPSRHSLDQLRECNKYQVRIKTYLFCFCVTGVSPSGSLTAGRLLLVGGLRAAAGCRGWSSMVRATRFSGAALGARRTVEQTGRSNFPLAQVEPF